MFRPAISAMLKGETRLTKEESSPLKIVYIFAISPDDVRDCPSKHVAYVINKLISEHLCCCTGLITTEGDVITTVG